MDSANINRSIFNPTDNSFHSESYQYFKTVLDLDLVKPRTTPHIQGTFDVIYKTSINNIMLKSDFDYNIEKSTFSVSSSDLPMHPLV